METYLFSNSTSFLHFTFTPQNQITSGILKISVNQNPQVEIVDIACDSKGDYDIIVIQEVVVVMSGVRCCKLVSN
jgi:hypothetical protein